MAAFKTIQHARNPESWSSGKSSSRGTWREGRRRRKHWLRNNSLACLTENAGCQFPWTLLPPSSNILMTSQCGQSPEGYLYSLWAAGPGCLLGLQSPSVLTAAGTWCKPHADLHRPDAGLKETTTVHAENMYCIQNPLDYSVMQSLQLLRVWMCVCSFVTVHVEREVRRHCAEVGSLSLYGSCDMKHRSPGVATRALTH